MSAQRLSAKKLRRIERVIGEPVLRGWARGGYIYYFVTPDHKHGWLDIKTDDWDWESGWQVHYTSCKEFNDVGKRIH